MRPGQPSWTAEGVASVRAFETVLHPRDRRVFDDPIALRMLRGRFRLIARCGPLARAAQWYQQHFHAGVGNELLARARFAQEHLMRLTAKGVRQIVIVGAGFDGTAWLPGLPDDLLVYEIDHPMTQRLKRTRLAEAKIQEPPRLVFVPTDLSRDALTDALRSTSFEPRRPALVTVLGLLMYLPLRSVERLFVQAGEGLAAESEVLYDHFSRYMLDSQQSPAGVRRSARRLARKGEPFLFAAEPGEMAALVLRAGLTQVESLDGADLTTRYFSTRGDRRTIERGVNLARAVKLTRSC